MNVAQLLVRCLEIEGVEYVFGVPGEENEDVLFALEDSEIRFVPTRRAGRGLHGQRLGPADRELVEKPSDYWKQRRGKE